VTAPIACIAADWGTSNLRAWALAADGAVLARKTDPRGLLGVEGRRFAEVFREVCSPWLEGAPRGLPAILCGMIGSRLGWKEAPYVAAPVGLEALAPKLCPVGETAGAAVSIVPGVSLDDPRQPDVMRGEETQILGALRALERRDACFLLPGTHSKWAIVEDGRLTAFRTYMTGEVFGLLSRSGTIAQLIKGETMDAKAFRRGVARAREGEGRDLLHGLFGVRALALFDRLAGREIRGFLSGLLIGAELSDALPWIAARADGRLPIAVGAPAMTESYLRAASLFDLELTSLDSAAILPPALHAIAEAAGLLSATQEGPGRP